MQLQREREGVITQRAETDRPKDVAWLADAISVKSIMHVDDLLIALCAEKAPLHLRFKDN